MKSAIEEAYPDSVDVFFDNVGGNLFDAVFANNNGKSRMVICEQIAEYNNENPPQGPRPQHLRIKKSAKIEGFVVFDYKDEFEDAKIQLAEWYNNGQLKYKENIIKGFDQTPSAFIGLFTGGNIGKQMVEIADEND